ncbi:MAG: 2OG-Fe(II) oxygenase [Chitinophagales bacterium]|nr:2OG-Fe(II) oxygenase [Chitinophagales bacterium]
MFKNIINWIGANRKETNDSPAILKPQPENKVIETPKVLEKEADNNLYNFNVVSKEEMKKYPDAIMDMFTGKTDGFLIKNFMSIEDVDKLLACLEEVRTNNGIQASSKVGFTYPTIFAEFSRKTAALSEEEKQAAAVRYYEEMEQFNNTFKEIYGVDALGQITDFFKSIGGNREVVQPKGSNKQGAFPFVTFRYLVPYQGLITIHCGNYFGATFNESYVELNQQVRSTDQMSYFIMLQEPEEGGELSLFNFRWQEGQTKVSPEEDNEIIQPDGTKIYVQTDTSILKNKLRPQKGDMILFEGGNIWHRVETIKGNIPRITFGGFLSFSHDFEKIYFWS